MNTWMTYVGKPKEFIKAARANNSISRRCPANVAKTMRYSDTVLCLTHRGKRIPPAIFARFVIDRILLDESLNIGGLLADAGKATFEDYTNGGTSAGIGVQRECGEYTMTGGYHLTADVTLAEIVELAQDEQKRKGGAKDQVFCMIGGTLAEEYDPPQTLLINAPQCTQGFHLAAIPTPEPSEPLTNAPKCLRGFHLAAIPTPEPSEPQTNQVLHVADYQKNG